MSNRAITILIIDLELYTKIVLCIGYDIIASFEKTRIFELVVTISDNLIEY